MTMGECVWDRDCSTGSCQKQHCRLSERRERCRQTSDCVAGLVCNTESNRCLVPGKDPKPRTDGACHEIFDCPITHYCDLEKGSCIPRSGFGDKCREMGDQCLEGLFCLGDRCEQYCIPDDSTHGCPPDYSCFSLNSQFNFCLARLAKSTRGATELSPRESFRLTMIYVGTIFLLALTVLLLILCVSFVFLKSERAFKRDYPSPRHRQRSADFEEREDTTRPSKAVPGRDTVQGSKPTAKPISHLPALLEEEANEGEDTI